MLIDFNWLCYLTFSCVASPRNNWFEISLAWTYLRRRAEASRAEIISARLGSAWHASFLNEENIAVLKQLY